MAACFVRAMVSRVDSHPVPAMNRFSPGICFLATSHRRSFSCSVRVAHSPVDPTTRYPLRSVRFQRCRFSASLLYATSPSSPNGVGAGGSTPLKSIDIPHSYASTPRDITASALRSPIASRYDRLQRFFSHDDGILTRMVIVVAAAADLSETVPLIQCVRRLVGGPDLQIASLRSHHIGPRSEE